MFNDNDNHEVQQYRGNDYRESDAHLVRHVGARKARLRVIQAGTSTTSGATALITALALEPNPQRVGFHLFFNGAAGLALIGLTENNSADEFSATRFTHLLNLNESWGHQIQWRYTGAIWVAFTVADPANRLMATEVLI